ncbi:hypothetical protein Pd630_LPD03814 [Rhodococcus opacus PD630]|nr:hypothetical protein Pd630_LPD03814 [Rhodococcus opacus PD630]
MVLFGSRRLLEADHLVRDGGQPGLGCRDDAVPVLVCLLYATITRTSPGSVSSWTAVTARATLSSS